MEIEFKIEGSSGLYGDGMAIWLTKDRAHGGAVFGSKDKFEGLGIFIDTYKNDRPGIVFPYIMAMVGDGNTSYDKAHDGLSNEIVPGCPVSQACPVFLSFLTITGWLHSKQPNTYQTQN
jgi:mannose-binding lectin 2